MLYMKIVWEHDFWLSITLIYGLQHVKEVCPVISSPTWNKNKEQGVLASYVCQPDL